MAVKKTSGAKAGKPKPKRIYAKRSYSDQQRAESLAALDANNGNVFRTAQQIKIPASTLTEWQNGRINEDVTNIREQKKESLAERLEGIAHQLLDELPDKIQDANLQQVATSLAIAIDKAQLLRGKPTAINEEQGVHEHRHTFNQEEYRDLFAEVVGLTASDDPHEPLDTARANGAASPVLNGAGP